MTNSFPCHTSSAVRTHWLIDWLAQARSSVARRQLCKSTGVSKLFKEDALQSVRLISKFAQWFKMLICILEAKVKSRPRPKSGTWFQEEISTQRNSKQFKLIQDTDEYDTDQWQGSANLIRAPLNAFSVLKKIAQDTSHKIHSICCQQHWNLQLDQWLRSIVQPEHTKCSNNSWLKCRPHLWHGGQKQRLSGSLWFPATLQVYPQFDVR